jgi:hypothetical protein
MEFWNDGKDQMTDDRRRRTEGTETRTTEDRTTEPQRSEDRGRSPPEAGKPQRSEDR